MPRILCHFGKKFEKLSRKERVQRPRGPSDRMEVNLVQYVILEIGTYIKGITSFINQTWLTTCVAGEKTTKHQKTAL